MSKHIYFNPTSSEVKGYYFVYKPHRFERKDLVLVCIRDKQSIKVLHRFGFPYAVSGNCKLPFLLKMIAAKNGDQVVVEDRGIVINNHLWPNTEAIIKHNNISLNKLPVGTVYKLGKNDYFLLGQGIHSYDSRYFGVVKAADLQYKAILFWPRRKPIW